MQSWWYVPDFLSSFEIFKLEASMWIFLSHSSDWIRFEERILFYKKAFPQGKLSENVLVSQTLKSLCVVKLLS